jgi:plastocyanin
MRRRLIAVGVVVVATAALAATALAQHAATPKLVGTVGPSYTINLTVGGKKVSKLKAGTYALVIHDRGSIHAWSLDGPNGFAKDLTTVPFVGTKTVTLKLKAGKYKYYCPPHEAMMFGHFTVVA